MFRRKRRTGSGEHSAHGRLAETERMIEYASDLIAALRAYSLDRDRFSRLLGTATEAHPINTKLSEIYRTDAGWAEAERASQGTVADAVKMNVSEMLDGYLKMCPDLTWSRDELTMAKDGLVRSSYHGWLVAYAEELSADGRWPCPTPCIIDPHSLLATTGFLLASADWDSVPDPVWFALDNRRGLSVYQWTVQPLGVPADQAVTNPAMQALISLGGVLIGWGYWLGTAQIIATRS
ncbi:MAG TPA: hypothetical protein VFH50_12960 [Acidimicrobiales bacterium]|nr:hypothetical protein [Acidimicrobiales bacterium]